MGDLLNNPLVKGGLAAGATAMLYKYMDEKYTLGSVSGRASLLVWGEVVSGL